MGGAFTKLDNNANKAILAAAEAGLNGAKHTVSEMNVVIINGMRLSLMNAGTQRGLAHDDFDIHGAGNARQIELDQPEAGVPANGTLGRADLPRDDAMLGFFGGGVRKQSSGGVEEQHRWLHAHYPGQRDGGQRDGDSRKRTEAQDEDGEDDQGSYRSSSSEGCGSGEKAAHGQAERGAGEIGQVKKSNMVNAWLSTGQHQNPSVTKFVGDEPLFGHEQSTVNIFQIMRQSSYAFTPQDYANVRTHAPEIIARLLTRGGMDPDWFDEFKLPRHPDEFRKDRSTANLDKLHACLLTHEYTVQAHLDRASALDPAHVQALKALADAKKEIDKLNKTAEKKKEAEEAAAAAKAQPQAVKDALKEQKNREAPHKKLCKFHKTANSFVTAGLPVPAEWQQYLGPPPALADVVLPPKAAKVPKAPLAPLAPPAPPAPARQKRKADQALDQHDQAKRQK